MIGVEQACVDCCVQSCEAVNKTMAQGVVGYGDKGEGAKKKEGSPETKGLFLLLSLCFHLSFFFLLDTLYPPLGQTGENTTN